MRTFRSDVFSFATDASPTRVWSALTCDEAGYLHGMDISSSWQPNAGIRIGGGSLGAGLAGTILYLSNPNRLSFSIDDPSGEVTYLTWTVRPTAAGCIVQLFVDESGDGDDEEYEAVWFEVSDRLQHQLRNAQASPGCES